MFTSTFFRGRLETFKGMTASMMRWVSSLWSYCVITGAVCVRKSSWWTRYHLGSMGLCGILPNMTSEVAGEAKEPRMSMTETKDKWIIMIFFFPNEMWQKPSVLVISSLSFPRTLNIVWRYSPESPQEKIYSAADQWKSSQLIDYFSSQMLHLILTQLLSPNNIYSKWNFELSSAEPGWLEW